MVEARGTVSQHLSYNGRYHGEKDARLRWQVLLFSYCHFLLLLSWSCCWNRYDEALRPDQPKARSPEGRLGLRIWDYWKPQKLLGIREKMGIVRLYQYDTGLGVATLQTPERRKL